MGYFPLYINIAGADVIIIGDGPKAEEKYKRLETFGANIHKSSTFTIEEMDHPPTFVIVGEVSREEKEYISNVCRENRIPVNVVDEPELCTFFFSSLITKGDLTVGISTSGKCPGAAAYLRNQIEEKIPDRTEDILDWANVLREKMRKQHSERDYRIFFQKAIALAFERNAPLSDEEVDFLLENVF